MGILNSKEALKIAKENNLDLVEVSPNAKPPVCRIMDYGKFRFDQKKKQREQKKKQKQIQLKEIQLRPKIDGHDYDIKLRKAKEFIEKGDKVKFSMIFRGRELSYINQGRELLEKAIEELKEVAQIERSPAMEGKRMILILAPIK